MKLSQAWSRPAVEFDETNLVSFGGLVPVLALGERAGLSELVEARLSWRSSRVASATANAPAKLTAIVAGMVAGADCIEDLDAVRTGGMSQLFDGVYAAATLGQFLREFTGGHVSQLESVARAHLVALVREVPELLPGLETRALVDVDSFLRPVYGHAKQGASFGHTKISGKQVLRRGLSPLATTIGTGTGPPVLAGIRLRAGRAGSARRAASKVREAVRLALALGATRGNVLVRGDSAYGNAAVANTARREGARFSLGVTRNPAVDRAIAAIGEDAWTPVAYPGAILDPDTGAVLSSDAQVAETPYTLRPGKTDEIAARLVVRRVRDRARDGGLDTATGELFPVWRHHPFLTDSDEDTAAADKTHRDHAVIETVFADLIDGPLAHMPSGRFAANAAWVTAAAIAHNLGRAAAVAAGGRLAKARAATLRRRLIAVPARPARPQRRPVMHLPDGWPWAEEFKALCTKVFGPFATGPPAANAS
ncbi:MAG: IS1380 family transposase [Sporichthyaceae bacterium]